MIQITVKTLDGADRKFDVSGDLSIKMFKEHIAPAVHIDALNQRLIYHGRVLQDEKVLNALDLDGKTLHLVQKLPNQSTDLQQNNVVPNRSEISEQQIVVGSVIVPVTNWNMQSFVYSINRILGRLGDVGSRASVNVSSQNADGCVEVAIILRDDSNVQVVDSPAYSRLHHVEHVLGHISHSLFHLENDLLNDDRDQNQSGPKEKADVEPKSRGEPRLQPSSEDSTESLENTDLAGVEASGDQATTSRTTANVREASAVYFSSVFERVLRLHDRLRPHMQRYMDLLQAEEDYSNNEARGRRDSAFFNSMQIILHNLGHVYHVLSDLNVHFCRPPPRFVEPFATRQPNTIVQAPEAHITVRFVPTTDAEAYQQFEQLLNMGGATQTGVNEMSQQQPSAAAPSASLNDEQPRPSVPVSEATQHQTSIFQRFFNNFLSGAHTNVTLSQPTSNAASTNQRQNQSFTTGQILTARHPHFANMQQQQTTLVIWPRPNSIVVRVPRTLLGNASGVPILPQWPGAHSSISTVPSAAGGVNRFSIVSGQSERQPTATLEQMVVQSLIPQLTFEQPVTRPAQTFFNVDPFLPCSSRHFDPRNRSTVSQTHHHTDSIAVAPAQPSQSASVIDGQVDEEALDIIELENTMERLLRSTLDAMRTHTVSAPTSVHVGIHAEATNLNMPPTSAGIAAINPQSMAAEIIRPRSDTALNVREEAETPIAEVRESVESSCATTDVLTSSVETTEEAMTQPKGEEWKSQVPTEWLDVIETDMETQNSLPPEQTQFSDAYLSGMPMKRRKIITDRKLNSNTDLTNLITQVDKSIEEVGVNRLSTFNGTSTKMDETLVTSLKENLKEKIRNRAHTDPNFDENRFGSVKKMLDN